MEERLRFHLDEHVHPAIADALRRQGVSVTTTQGVGLRGASDPEQIAFAWRERRVLVTHDDDFLRWHSRGIPHAGVAYCHLGARSLGEMIERLLLIYESLGQDEMIGRVQFL